MHLTLFLLVAWCVWEFGLKKPWQNEKTARSRREIPDKGCARQNFVMPPLDERIDSCYRTLEQIQETEDDEAVALMYTRGKMFRAIIFYEMKSYQVCYQSLHLWDEVTMSFDYEPGKSCGYWMYDGGESWFDDLESAEDAARTVIAQLEGAEESLLKENE